MIRYLRNKKAGSPKRETLFLSEQFFYCFFHAIGRGRRFVSCCDVAFFVHKEFGEVPFDIIAFHDFREVLADEVFESFGFGIFFVKAFEFFLFCQVAEQGLCSLSADVIFFKELECHAIVQAAEALDFFIASRILLCELIAWKSENFQPPVLIFLI